MARRKRLNKRVVVVLVALGVVLTLFGARVLIQRIPADPAEHRRRGDELLASAEQARADRDFRQAVEYATEAARHYDIAASASDDPCDFYKCAQALHELLRVPTLSETDQRQVLMRLGSRLQSATLLDPAHEPSLRLRAAMDWQRCLHVRHDEKGVIRWYPEFLYQADQVLRVDPNDAEMLFRRATAKARLADAQPDNPDWKTGAAADYAQATALDPDNERYWLGWLDLTRRTGTQTEALSAFERAVQAAPNSPRIRAAFAGHLRELGNYEQSLAQIDEAIRRAPDETLGYLAKAEHYRSQKRFDEALEALEQARGVDDTDYRVYGMLAQLHVRRKHRDKAIEEVRAGLEAIADNSGGELTDLEKLRYATAAGRLHYLLTGLLLDEARGSPPERREELIRQARVSRDALAKIMPASFEYQTAAGHVAFAERDYAQAATHLERAMKLTASAQRVDTRAANLLTRAYVALGHPSRAVSVYQYLRRLDRDNPSALVAEATVDMIMREYKVAEDLVKRALDIDADNRPALIAKAILDVVLHGQTKLPEDVELNSLHLAVIRDHAENLWAQRATRPDAANKVVTLAEQLHQRLPGDAKVVRLLLAACRETGQEEKAEQFVEAVAEANPELARRLAFRRKLLAESDPNRRFAMQMAEASRQWADEPFKKALHKATICFSYQREEPFLAYLDQAQRLQPNHRAVINLRWQHAVRQEDWPQAERWIDKAIELAGDDSWGLGMKASYHVARRQLRQATETLEEVLRRQPENKGAYVTLGDCHRILDQLDEAEDAYRQALSMDRSFLPAMRGMIYLETERGRHEEADKWVENAYARPDGPRDPFIRGRYMQLVESRGDPEQLGKVIAVREATLRRKPQDLGNAYRLATLYEQTEQNERAEQVYLHLFRRGGDRLRWIDPLLAFYRRTGQRGRILEALAALAEAPDKVAVHIKTGQVLADYDPRAAEAAFREAIDANAEDPRTYRALARFHAGRDQFASAAKHLSEYLRRGGTHPGVRHELIAYQIRYRQDDLLADARQRIAAMLKRDRRDVNALSLRGWLHYHSGRTDLALADLTEALRIDPHHRASRRRRAAVYETMGLPKEARDDIEVLMQALPEPELVETYAELCAGLGDFSDAEAAYRQQLRRRRHGHPVLLHGLMKLFLRRQQWDALQEVLDDARRNFSSKAWYQLVRYQMWRRRSDPTRAVEAVTAAVNLAEPIERARVLRTCILGLLQYRMYDRVLELCDANGQPASAAMDHWLQSVRARTLAATNRAPQAQTDKLFLDALSDAPADGKVFAFQQMVDAYGRAAALEKLRGWGAGPLAGNAHVQLMLGRELTKPGGDRTAEGLAALRKARHLASSPRQRAMVAMALGAAFHHNERLDEATEAWKQALEFSWKDARTRARLLNNLAYLYVEGHGAARDALTFAERAYALMPGSADILDTYGWVLTKRRNYVKAEDVLRRAVRLAPDKAAFRYHLGYLQEQQGRLEEAGEHYRAALERVGSADQTDLRQQIQQALNRVTPRAARGRSRTAAPPHTRRDAALPAGPRRPAGAAARRS
jgi:tetratricopeptide (TPR) repeat protein